MTRRLALAALTTMLAGTPGAPAAQTAAALPVVVFETARGTIEFQLFEKDAPKSTAHLLALVRKNFYRGLRVHRAERSLVQVGDPLTRDVSRRAYWGSGGSGRPIGVAEFSKLRVHRRGAVGLAHAGAPEYADSQIYFMKADSPSLNGKHVVVGQVTAGMSVVDTLVVTDVVRRAYVKGEGPRF